MAKYYKPTYITDIHCPCGWSYVAKNYRQGNSNKVPISVLLHRKVCSGIVKDDFVMGVKEADKQRMDRLNKFNILAEKLVNYATSK